MSVGSPGKCHYARQRLRPDRNFIFAKRPVKQHSTRGLAHEVSMSLGVVQPGSWMIDCS